MKTMSCGGDLGFKISYFVDENGEIQIIGLIADEFNDQYLDIQKELIEVCRENEGITRNEGHAAIHGGDHFGMGVKV